MTTPVTVACVLKSGGAYNAQYVERLQHGVRTFLPGARFVCLSDVDVPCERIPLVAGLPGWLSKLELFRPELFEGRVLYLDLDTIVVRSLAPLAAHPHRFTMLSDFFHPEKPGSGVMAWEGDYRHLYERFTPELIPQYREFRPYDGDGGWIARQLGFAPERFQTLFPRQVVSYKREVRRRTGRAQWRLVCFHGSPRPHEVGWAL